MSTASVPVRAAALVRRKPPPTVRRQRFLVAVANHSLLIAAAIIFIAPFGFIVLTALMTNEQALSVHLWPHPFRWRNFTDVFHEAPILRWTLNTMIYSSLATLGLVVSSVPVAYALARIRWRGRNLAFMVVLIALMLPPQVTVVPLYVMWTRLGQHIGFHFVGSLWPLIVPNWFGDAFSIFLLRQFFLTIPEEYLDAARVDGCGELRILTTVVLRMAKPAIAAVALFSFLYTFNDFFLPLLYVGENPSHWVLSIGLSEFRSLRQVQWNLTMAATLLVMAPVVLATAARAGKRAASDAWIVDFTNPVGIVTRALLDTGHRAVGLCNVSIGFQRGFARRLGVEPERVLVDNVGLNHLTWVRSVRVDGEDVLPDLLAEHGDELAAEARLPRRFLDELGVIPSYYLHYFYAHDEVLAEQRDGVPRARRVMEIERELLDMYRDPALAEKPALLEQRGGALYSEAAIRLAASLAGRTREAPVA